VRPNPPLFCERCNKQIPNRKDRQTKLCFPCTLAHRCSHCGQAKSILKEHRCMSIDKRGPRYCTECGREMRNQGYERWHTVCGVCGKSKWRAKERAALAALKAEFGNQCQKCGYNRCQAALHFHHKQGRDIPDSRSNRNRGKKFVDDVRANLERFALLCANCHFETHYGAKKGPTYGAEDLPRDTNGTRSHLRDQQQNEKIPTSTHSFPFP
jgi:hypothetical protein